MAQQKCQEYIKELKTIWRPEEAFMGVDYILYKYI